jgi:hypothetical protein
LAAAKQASGKRQTGDADHGAEAAVRTGDWFVFGEKVEQRLGLCGLWKQIDDSRQPELAAEREFGLAMAVVSGLPVEVCFADIGQEAKVTDALKAGRQGVQQKAADELGSLHLHVF